VAVEKQSYSQGPLVDTLVNPMSIEAATSEISRHSSPRRKRTKLAESSTFNQASGSIHYTEDCENMSALPVKKQYLTRSKASKTAAHRCSGKQGTFKGHVPVYSSFDDSAPTSLM